MGIFYDWKRGFDITSPIDGWQVLKGRGGARLKGLRRNKMVFELCRFRWVGSTKKNTVKEMTPSVQSLTWFKVLSQIHAVSLHTNTVYLLLTISSDHDKMIKS